MDRDGKPLLRFYPWLTEYLECCARLAQRVEVSGARMQRDTSLPMIFAR
jgi:hypothetical protein